MSNLNKVMLIGRLGSDPESRTIQSGSTVCNFSIATSEKWKDKSGDRQEKTEWHNIVAWGLQASFTQEYLRKGSLVYVEGSLQTKDWVDSSDVKHYKTEVKAFSVQSLVRQEQQQGQQSGGGDTGNQSGYEDDDVGF